MGQLRTVLFDEFKRTVLRTAVYDDVFQGAVVLADDALDGSLQRSRALWDNVRVVCEVDKWTERVRLLPHLLFPWMVCKLRGK